MKKNKTYKNAPKEINVISAKYIDGFRLQLQFDDGAKSEVDLSSFLRNPPNPLFQKYLQKKNFKQFQIVNGNLNWNDYEMIFPIAQLYAGSIF
jgi:hypothetical protein